MKKIIVIGCPGAGKSTFARRLRDKTGLPLYYLDMLWHKPDRTTASREAFDVQLERLLKRDRWIIDGNFLRTLEIRLEACDTAILMDIPLEVCLTSVKNRIGQVREDMPWVETEFDPEFKQWIIDFPQNQLPQIYKLLKRYQRQKNVVVLRSREEAERYLRNLGQENKTFVDRTLPESVGLGPC